jgi:O-antigen/teichoic acid export membrane protein
LRVSGYLTGALISAGSAALLFRHLGVADTGQYTIILALVAIVGGVSDLGLTAVAVRESSVRPPTERSQLLSDLLGMRISLTTFGMAILLAVTAFSYSSTVFFGVLLAGCGLLLQTVQDNLAVPLLVRLRLGWVSTLDLTRQMLTILSIAALVLAGARLLPFLAVSIPVGILVLVSTALLVRSERSLMPSFSWNRWRPLLMRVLPYSAAVAAAALYFRVAIVVVSQLSDSHQLGLFGSSYRIIEVLSAVPILLAGTALPIFAHAAQANYERLGYALGRVFEVALIVGVWVAVSTIVGAKLAIAIVGGPAFAAASGVLAIQGVAPGATFVSAVWANGLLSLALYRQILMLNACALLLSLVVLVALVPPYGARGAAVGTVLGEIGAAVGGAVILIRHHAGLRPPLRVIPRVAAAAALGLVPLLFGGVPVILRLAISTVLYSSVLLATRAFPTELLDLLPRGRFHTKASGP